MSRKTAERKKPRRRCGAGVFLQMQFQPGVLLCGVAEDAAQADVGGAQSFQQRLRMDHAHLHIIVEIGETVVEGVQIAAVLRGKLQLLSQNFMDLLHGCDGVSVNDSKFHGHSSP